MDDTEKQVRSELAAAARMHGLDVFGEGAGICRTSSRFCLGVEHGDYNGTELFGVGTDRFIWMAYKANGTDRMRLYSTTFPADGLLEVPLTTPPPAASSLADSWARFPNGVAFVLQKAKIAVTRGFDAVIVANIPGGGMSRSASLSINLILTLARVNGTVLEDMQVVDLSQGVEKDYVGSPCGNLDQIMIYFAKENMGTHYNPKTRSVSYIPLGADCPPFAIVSLDTGTMRPGLEKSTYVKRRAECTALTKLLQADHGIETLADVRDEKMLEEILAKYGSAPDPSDPQVLMCQRLRYLYAAQKRFYEMLEAWKAGDIARVGAIFRDDGVGLRDLYDISGPELESMCDIVRTVPGCLGERMLGGGDKGAAGCIVREDAIDAVKAAVDTAFPRTHPAFATKYATHVCRVVAGVVQLDGVQ